MKYFNILITALICVAMGSCAQKKADTVKDISVQESKELMSSNKDLIVLDVRTPEEWEEGTIDNAIKVNFFDSDFADKMSKLDNSKPVLVYCKSGGRSAKAANILDSKGFTEIYNMLGGYTEYSASE